jgi:hypothetical protein
VRRALLRCAVLLLALGPVAVAAPPSWAGRARPHVLRLPDDADPAADGGCGPPAADPVPDHQPIVVTLPPGPSFTVGQIPASWWRTPPYGDGGWRLHLRGFMWVQPLARRAYDDGQRDSLTALVDQILAFHADDPDPGTATAAATARADAWAWDEGTSLRRLMAENCLYALTGDARLEAAVRDDVAVQFGPRFYGPPYHAVHNHGVMADRAVLVTASLLHRTDLRDQVVARLLSEAPAAFTPAGTTKEQSSLYHRFNAVLWAAVAGDLQQRLGAADPRLVALRAEVARAAAVEEWLTQPDGNIAVFGDAFAEPGSPAPARTERTFRDDVAGVIAGRWSWTDPATTYYVLRYGPRRWAHGQYERGGVTWATAGVRVLVDPGRGAYDPLAKYATYAMAPSSHNVATADRRAYTDAGTCRLTGAGSRTSWHSWTTTDTLYGITHVRTTSIVRQPRSLTATDTFAGRAGFHQFWHLDPSWTLTGGNAAGTVLTFASGAHRLTLRTTGTATVRRGSTRPVAGWNFPAENVRVGAVQVQVAAAGTATTSFAVT